MQVNLEEKPKTYVVINPVAGLSQLEVVRERIQAALQERDIPCEIYETTGKEDLRQMIRETVQQGYKLFISAGGDGTLSAVVDGLVGTQAPLVIIPTGTWNALARALDIPLQLEQAVDLLFQEHTIQTIDAMQVDKNYFVLSISAGAGSLTMKGVEREEKRRWGRLADLRSAISQLLRFRSYRFEVRIDGKSSRFRASELMIANSSILGIKALQLDPNIRMDDGKLNVCRISGKSVWDYLGLAVKMLAGGQKRNWNMVCLEALEEVEIHCRQNLPVQGDGDLIGRLPITVKIRPKAIRIVTPLRAEV
ncbi:MAG: diacylglycerol kinase family lipid kinase [Anaerolineales bacterium]|nr:diacylglycerol kinase family lipid kinase [Anaerolineales bacterium]